MQSSGISLAVTSTDAQASHKIPFPHHTIWFGRGNSVDTGSLTRPPFYPDWRKPSWICHPSVTQGPQAGRPGCRADPHLGHRLFPSQVFFLAGWLLPKHAGPGNATSPGCGTLLSLRHPLETATGEGRRLATRIRKPLPVPSAGH